MVLFLVLLFQALINKLSTKFTNFADAIVAKVQKRITTVTTVLTLIRLIAVEVFYNVLSNFGIIKRSEERRRVKCDLRGRTVLVTNCADNLGMVLTLELYKRGAVVIACHNRPEGNSNEVVKHALKLAIFRRGMLRGQSFFRGPSGHPLVTYHPFSPDPKLPDVATDFDHSRPSLTDPHRGGQIIVRKLDFSSFAAINGFVSDLINSGTPLHGVVNNQDLFATEQGFTDHGIDLVHQVNYVGPFYLMSKLFNHMSQSSELEKNFSPVIINFANELCSYYCPKVFLSKLFDGGNIFDSYANSKSAVTVATFESAAKLSNYDFRFYLIDSGIKLMDIKNNYRGLINSENGSQRNQNRNKTLRMKIKMKFADLLLKLYLRTKYHILRNPSGIMNHVLMALDNNWNCDKLVLR